MKKLLTIVLIVFTFSCSKKDKTDSNSFEVEYQISAVSNMMLKITYIDTNGTPVETDYNGFSSGSKKIRPNTKPFASGIQVEVNNVSNAPITYSLLILVDGQPKAVKPCNAPAMNLSTASVQYTVQ